MPVREAPQQEEVISPAAGRGCWCSSRWPAGRTRRWTGCRRSCLHTRQSSTPCGGDPEPRQTQQLFSTFVLELAQGRRKYLPIGLDSPVCCFVGAEPVAPRTCRTDGPVDCREAERWSSGSRTRWSWTEQEEKIRLETQSSATFSSRDDVFITNFDKSTFFKFLLLDQVLRNRMKLKTTVK